MAGNTTSYSGRISAAAAVLSAIAAAIAIYLSISQMNSTAQRERIQRWQSVLVYKIISESNTPVAFDDIKTAYLQAVQQRGTQFGDVPNEEIQDDALLYVLVSLLERQAIVRNAAGSYAVSDTEVHGPRSRLAQIELTELEERRRLRNVAVRVMDEIRQKSGEYTHDELYRYVVENIDKDLDLIQFREVLVELHSYQIASFTNDGRIIYHTAIDPEDYSAAVPSPIP